jgi:hypothetical protein
MLPPDPPVAAPLELELELDELAVVTAPPAPVDVDAPDGVALLPPHAVSKLTATAMPTAPRAEKQVFIEEVMPLATDRRSAHRAVR